MHRLFLELWIGIGRHASGVPRIDLGAAKSLATVTYLANDLGVVRVRGGMNEACQPSGSSRPNIAKRIVVKTIPEGPRTECVFVDGTSIVVSNFFSVFVRPQDEVFFPLDLQQDGSSTQIRLHPGADGQRPDILHSEIGYVAKPSEDGRGDLFVKAEIPHPYLGISAIHIPCEAVKDYFFVANRHRNWDRQKSLYELLRVDPKAPPAELRVAFQLRTLELRAANAPVAELRRVERIFNVLASPELRASYDRLRHDPQFAASFPYGGFGSLIVAGRLTRDGRAFYARRILSFRPRCTHRELQIPARNLRFYEHHAVYRNPRQQVEILFDHASLPLSWDASWNQWKHLLGVRIRVKAVLVQTGTYQQREGAWSLRSKEVAVPSRIDVSLPSDLADRIAEARKIHHQIGRYAAAVKSLRERLECEPIEFSELREICSRLGMEKDFDVAWITWKPDYDSFFYKELRERARFLYLFRAEYIFQLEQAVVVETPHLGHATYLFARPSSMAEFLASYGQVARKDLLQNRANVAERLGFIGRLIHSDRRDVWLKELKVHLGEQSAACDDP